MTEWQPMISEDIRRAFLKVLSETADKELGCYSRDDGDGVYTIDGAFNLDTAIAAAIRAADNDALERVSKVLMDHAAAHSNPEKASVMRYCATVVLHQKHKETA